MAIPEQFSLRWNDFHSNLSQSFHALLEGEDMVDVTLAAGGQYVHAHKLILSVCSPYFKELFKTNPCEHPIVILKDVAHQELKQLLQFMYRGEVHVRQQELPGFLHTAELLQVKGLTGGRERSESPPPAKQPKMEEPPRPLSRQDLADSQVEWVPGGEDTIATESSPETEVKDEQRSPLKRLLKNTPSKNNYNMKKKPRPVNDNTHSPTHAENTEHGYDSEPLIDFDNDLYHSVLVLPESAKESGWNCKTGGVKCPSCHRFFANRYNLKVHIRDKHDTREGTLQCDICQKRMRNPSCLRVHMYHHRKQAAYLAQLSAQGEQMRIPASRKQRPITSLTPVPAIVLLNHLLGKRTTRHRTPPQEGAFDGEHECSGAQNIVEGKWRGEGALGSGDYENYPSPTPAPVMGAAKMNLVGEPAYSGPPEAVSPKGEADLEHA